MHMVLFFWKKELRTVISKIDLLQKLNQGVEQREQIILLELIKKAQSLTFT